MRDRLQRSAKDRTYAGRLSDGINIDEGPHNDGININNETSLPSTAAADDDTTADEVAGNKILRCRQLSLLAVL